MIERLSPMAARCLKLFSWFQETAGSCFPSVAWIAGRLKVSPRTIRAATAELARVGAIEKRRRGPRSSIYVVMWEKPFHAQRELFEKEANPESVCPSFAYHLAEQPIYELENKTMPAKTTSEAEPNRTPEAQPWTVLGYRQVNDNRYRLEYRGDESRAVDVTHGEVSEPEPTPIIARAAAQSTSFAEIEALSNALRRFVYRDGSAVEPEPELVERIFKIASYYKRTGFYIAALLYRINGQVERSPSTRPERAAWFLAVVESKLRAELETPRKAVARAAEVASVKALPPIQGTEVFVDTKGLVGDLIAGMDRRKAG